MCLTFLYSLSNLFVTYNFLIQFFKHFCDTSNFQTGFSHESLFRTSSSADCEANGSKHKTGKLLSYCIKYLDIKSSQVCTTYVHCAYREDSHWTLLFSWHQPDTSLIKFCGNMSPSWESAKDSNCWSSFSFSYFCPLSKILTMIW